MHQKAPHHPVRSFVQGLLTVSLFIVLTAWVLLVANGYTVNLRSGSVRQTTAISLNGTPTQAVTVLNGTPVGARLPLTLRHLDAGRHTVRVSADGYQDWQVSVTLGPGAAARLDRIALFLTEPALIAEQALLGDSVIAVVDPTLEVVGGELYRLEQGTRQLVTRFSQPIVAARSATDRAHLFVQLGASVYVTELDGANTTKLLELPTADEAVLAINSSLSELTVDQNDVRRTWKIR